MVDANPKVWRLRRQSRNPGIGARVVGGLRTELMRIAPGNGSQMVPENWLELDSSLAFAKGRQKLRGRTAEGANPGAVRGHTCIELVPISHIMSSKVRRIARWANGSRLLFGVDIAGGFRNRPGGVRSIAGFSVETVATTSLPPRRNSRRCCRGRRPGAAAVSPTRSARPSFVAPVGPP